MVAMEGSQMFLKLKGRVELGDVSLQLMISS